MSITKKQTGVSVGITELRGLSRWVKSLKPHELNLFDRLYTGLVPVKGSPKKTVVDENRFATVLEVLESTSDEEDRATRLINLVNKLENDIIQLKIYLNGALKRKDSDVENANHNIEKKFLAIFDASLLIKEGLDYGLYRNLEDQNKAQKIVDKYSKWSYESSIKTKLPEFEYQNNEIEYQNTVIFQQLCGKVPPSPIAHQILSFSLLDWQRRMFMKLKDGKNVICCAPTSSGKTMIALGFIYTFLKYRPKSLLVYVAPNNVLAMEISAILNNYVSGQVSTLLDDRCDRKLNERVVVTTPTGAFTHAFIDEKIQEDSFLVVDEVHCIGNEGGVKMEYCLRKFSVIQTLILSATMTQKTIEKLKKCIRNKNEIHEINETTRFMIPQHVIPKSNEEGIVNLVPLNPMGSINYEDLGNPNLDIPMTPRDVQSLFVKICKTMGGIIPEYLHPIRFFFVHQCKKPAVFKTLDEINEEEDPTEESTGYSRRLSLDDFALWQKELINFLSNPEAQSVELCEGDWEEKVKSILDSYKMSLTDDSTAICNLENAYKLVEKLKSEHMLQALFFFPNAYRAFNYATYIYSQLAAKPSDARAEKKDKEVEAKIEALKKQLASLERVKLKSGADAKDLKERKYQLKNAISELEGTGSFSQSCNSLSENIITGEEFDDFIGALKKWNPKITQSSPLAQMVLYGIGVLSGDMPYDLQVLIRGLYYNGSIAILMVTEDCAYGINTPTRTVALSDGFTESQRRQMAGRAGRKGIVTSAWVVYFRLQNPEEAGQKLCDLKGTSLTLYTNNRLPGEENWITKISHQDHPYKFTKEEYDTVKSFWFKTKKTYGHGAIMAPFITMAAIKGTVGQTNRHISVILSVIAVTPFNEPCSNKEGWVYELPEPVKKLYFDNGFGEVLPNYTVYMWLTNQNSDLNSEEKEKLVEVSKYWSYLFLLLRS